jgi:Proteasome complex subunit Rpn13 ubiquitin receptor
MSRVLVSCRAGMMSFDGKKVASDPRQGKLTLYYPTGEEFLLLHWQPVSSETDQSGEDIVIVTTSQLSRVNAAKTGRVYVLKQEESRNFFWGQEGDEEEEAALIEKLNSLINDPVATIESNKKAMTEFFVAEEDNHHQFANEKPTSSPMEIWNAPTDGVNADGEIQIPSNLTQEQMLALLQHMMEDDEDDDDEDDYDEGDGFEDEEIHVEPIDEEPIPTSTSAAAAVPPQPIIQGEQPTLSTHVFTKSTIDNLLENSSEIEPLLDQLLPPGQSLEECLKSAQFRSSLDSLTEAIYSQEGLQMLFALYGLEYPTNPGNPLKAFCDALQKKFTNNSE